MKKIYFGLTFLATTVGLNVFGQGDNCAGAVLVTPGSYFANGPSSGGGGQGGGSGVYNADWYSFVPVCNGTITVSSCGSFTDTRLYIHNGSLGCPIGGSSIIANNDDFCAGFASQVTNVPVTGGTTYYIEWDNFWTSSSFNWTLSYNSGTPGVTGVTSLPTAISADIDWNPAGAETDWIIQYGLNGFVFGSGTTSNVLVSNVTLNGLSPLTTYQYYIQAGSDVCSTVGPFSFTTLALCPEPTLTNVTGITTDLATLNWTAGGIESMWDVEWDASGFLLGTGNQDFGLLTNSDALSGLTSLTNYHWYVRAVCDLNLGDGVDTTSYFVGPLSFITDQICTEPTGLNVTGITSFGSNLNWSAGGLETEWNVQWGDAGFTLNGLGANLISGTSSIPAPLTGLTPNSPYQFYVQSVCGSTPDSLSQWVGPFNWSTPVYCNTPSGLSSSALTTTGATISWLAGGLETDWTYEYGLNGFTPGTGTTVNTISSTANLTGLMPGTSYCFYVQSNCGATPDSSSSWVGPVCFNTVIACPQPTNLGAINITNTAANLLWQAGGTETMWNLEWGLPGFNPGAGEEEGSAPGTTSIPTYATGLNVSNSYEFYVQADCGGNGSSVWSGPYSFNTLMVNDIPCDAIDLFVDGTINTYSNVLATNNGEGAVVPTNGACDDNMSWCGYSTINGPMWFKFKASASGSAYVSTLNSVTEAYGSHTEIAVYSVGICGNYSTYTLLGANTGSNWDISSGTLSEPGSEVLVCSGLTPGNYYYVMVDAFTGNQYGWGGTVYNAFQGPFGISVDDLPTPNAGTSIGATICENNPSFDLFTTITGNSSTNGIWYNPDVQPGNELPSTLDFTGVAPGTYDFYYVDGSTCATDTVQTSVIVDQAPNAGNDNSYTTCNTYDITLIIQLGGNPSFGGTWSDDDATGKLNNGVFDAFGLAAGTYDFTYTVSGGSCPNSTSTLSVTLTDCLTLDENSATTLSVYPNPVVDVLTIQNLSIDGNAKIDVLDIQGKVVSSTQVAGIYGNYNVDMKNIESGVYIVRVSTDDLIQEVRVVKQ